MEQPKQLRTSLYTIFIPLEGEFDEWMIVHGYTGAMDIVNDEIAQFLRKGGHISPEMYAAEDYPFNAKSLDRLVRRGYLTEKAPLEEKAWVQLLANHLHQKQRKGNANFCFLVAYDCNFRCPYCFENGISNNGKGWSKKTFTKDSVDRAYAAMKEIEPDPGKITRHITLYGGEPLLARNFPVVEYMVKKGIEEGFYFSAITNGYELQHYKEVLGPGKITTLQITIDGPKRVHDTRRTHFEDGSTFDRIMDNIAMCLEMEVYVTVRINTELKNFEYIHELNTECKQRGFFNSKYFSMYSGLIHGEDEISCNVVMAPQKAEEAVQKYDKAFGEIEVMDEGFFNPDSQYINFEAEHQRQEALLQFHYEEDEGELEESEKMRTMNRVEYLNKFKQAYKDNPELRVTCQDFGIISKVNFVLKGNALFNFNSTFCSAQSGMYILDPCGDIYACWELVGRDEFIVGQYKDGITYDQEALERWQGKNISKVDACSKCKYAFFCGGGCMAGALREGRGYNSPHCDGFPRMFQDIVPRTYFQHLDNVEKEKRGEKVEEITVANQII